jgi:anti-sigma B factor antagonist
MLAVYRHVTGSKGRLVLTGLNDEVKDTMEMTGFLDQFTTAATVDEGIQALQ